MVGRRGDKEVPIIRKAPAGKVTLAAYSVLYFRVRCLSLSARLSPHCPRMTYALQSPDSDCLGRTQSLISRSRGYPFLDSGEFVSLYAKRIPKF